MIPAVWLAAAATFNLICTGETYYVRKLLGPREGLSPYTVNIRVDLDRRRWCHDSCESTLDMVEVTDRRLVFIRDERGVMDDTIFFVNRETGSLMRRTRLGEFMSLSEAQCERAPFTGFPRPKF